jgi:hypothetical protein
MTIDIGGTKPNSLPEEAIWPKSSKPDFVFK